MCYLSSNKNVKDIQGFYGVVWLVKAIFSLGIAHNIFFFYEPKQTFGKVKLLFLEKAKKFERICKMRNGDC